MEPIAYYIVHHAQQAGPFTQEQLQEMVATGTITRDQAGWRMGMNEWRPLGELLPTIVPRTQKPNLQPAPPVVMPERTEVRKKSRTWLWVTLTVLVFLFGAGALIVHAMRAVIKRGTADLAFVPLQEERREHEIKWKNNGPKSIGPTDQPDGRNFQLVSYDSPAGKLSAYLTPDPKDSKRHPAIVWAHSSSGGIDDSCWLPTEDGYNLSARAFREKGIVMMCPSWRGENENPGRIELLYGEVDDLLAAIEHVKRLPYVDPAQVYIGGHNVGGTLVLLAACASDQFRAAFSFGGMVDGAAMLRKSKHAELPFVRESERDLELRSPLRYAAFIRRPVFYFEAVNSFEHTAVRQMERRARPHFQAFVMPGTHFDIVHPTTQLIAEKIAAGSELHFTNEELIRSHRLADYNDQKALLASPIHDDHGLSGVLAKAVPGNTSFLTFSDVKILENALITFHEKKDLRPETMVMMGKMAALRQRINDAQVIRSFDVNVPHWLSKLALMRLQLPAEITQEEENSMFNIMLAVAGTPEGIAADLVAELAVRGLGPDAKLEWVRLFTIYDVRHSQTGRFLNAFAGSPPGGPVGEALLTHINHLISQGWEGANPYNSAQGSGVLRSWVEDRNPNELVRACIAVQMAAFLDAALREELLQLALKHPNKAVHVQAAWSDVKSGGTWGVKALKNACLDIEVSTSAQNCLRSLLLEDEIPETASNPDNIAKSTLSQMLAQPGQLGTQPLSIEVYDQRNLFWPPAKERLDIWLIKFTFKARDRDEIMTSYACYSKNTLWWSLQGDLKPASPQELYLHLCTEDLASRARRAGTPLTMIDARRKALMALRENNPAFFDSVRVSAKP
ncbi:MAG: DUF4339 domain-containing protein [Prosthecobacter sp.]|jgi:hypothetical protein|uniref:GYF domain-containing protein n=1 Tax=Prosthecobacter sp. TaxID=1965333 RepID=UPI0019F72A66|nr:GYF domain-containing protein [Prosthecobacter sp.]MBE2284112.1 DUF4339 domain-containing protein [Prosthecobacter sp.]